MNHVEKEKEIKSAVEEITGVRICHEDFLEDNKQLPSAYTLTLEDDKGKEIAKLHDLKEFEDVLLSVDKNIILNYAKKNKFSQWLKDIGEEVLAKTY